MKKHFEAGLLLLARFVGHWFGRMGSTGWAFVTIWTRLTFISLKRFEYIYFDFILCILRAHTYTYDAAQVNTLLTQSERIRFLCTQKRA